ncbi:MAG: dihydrolipoyl dehydrogenase family protein [Mitsuokella sp.]|uniref:dihydrolipoyl dehydrogenase family protein n=1 Tax=Mitsuokella sp. TaxID=2049034 RepID=UPI003F088A50
MKAYDVIIIGTGAGNIIADAAIRAQKTVAIIERGRFGGTCLNRGCIPTKVMVTAANLVCEMRESARIGVLADNIRLDWETVAKRLWQKIDEGPGIQTYYDQFPNVTTYNGTASFTGKKTLLIEKNDGGREEIEGQNIFIATGGRTNIPKLPGLAEAGYVTSETFFGQKFPKKPYKSLIVIGGGPIGCEFSHAFRAAGTKVTIVQHNVRLLPKEDEEISAFMLKQFEGRGIEVLLNKDTVSVRVEHGEKVLSVQDRKSGEQAEVRAEEILVAPGIRPMTELLHLEHTDVSLDKRGYIRTNEFLETSAEGIYALGDINGKAPFRHKANYEAEILAHNLFEGRAPEDWRWADYDAVPAVTYTYPEAAHVGLTEKEAQAQGYETETAHNNYSAAVKGFALGFEPGRSDDGFVKLVLDKRKHHILGAHIVGHEASILIQPFINLLMCGKHTIKPISGDIASETAKKLRALPLTRDLDPRSVYTLGESMTPHPSLSEVTMWTRYYYEKK